MAVLNRIARALKSESGQLVGVAVMISFVLWLVWQKKAVPWEADIARALWLVLLAALLITASAQAIRFVANPQRLHEFLKHRPLEFATLILVFAVYISLASACLWPNPSNSKQTDLILGLQFVGLASNLCLFIARSHYNRRKETAPPAG